VIENKDVVVNVEDPPREVILDIDLRFRDLKAAVPLYTTDLSVRNNALIRPIVAFIK
jgi:distribution and morphology protein 31